MPSPRRGSPFHSLDHTVTGHGMLATVDHAFICCSKGAPEADALVALGLIEGSGNRHPGQGTSNRRFFFNNAYVELLWVSNEDEARSSESKGTRLWERCSSRSDGICPFGILRFSTSRTWASVQKSRLTIACRYARSRRCLCVFLR